MKKKQFIGLLGVGAVIIIGLCVLAMFFHTRPVKLDVAEGCKEFYSVNWGMSVKDIDRRVKVEHDYIIDENPDDSEIVDSLLYTVEPMEVFGLSANKVYCVFDGDVLKGVQIMFPKDSVTHEQLMEAIVSVYGEPHKENQWIGSHTSIELIDMQEKDQTEKNFLVWYSRAVDDQYEFIDKAAGDTSKLDPLGILFGENSMFGKSGEELTEGLVLDRDYNLDEQPGEYKNYSMYPSFEFMGQPAGNTAVEFLEKDNGICMIAYRLVLPTHDQKVRGDIVQQIMEELTSVYGEPKENVYIEVTFDEPVEEVLSKDEWFNRIYTNIEGTYHMNWENEDTIQVAFRIFNDKYSEYTNAYIVFTNSEYDIETENPAA